MNTLLIEPRDRRQFLVRDDWSVTMRWQNLLFAHWPVRQELLRPLIPAALEIDTFDGQAWIGIVPFYLTIRFRRMPSWCALTFPELNVRTYVKQRDKQGVWFLSLDASSRLAVWVARNRYRLPYHSARIDFRSEGRSDNKRIRFCSQRIARGAASAELQIDYAPVGESYHAEPDSLEYWLTERYCLFAASRHGKIACGNIDHRPWSLQLAEADLGVNTMVQTLGIATPPVRPLLHFSRDIRAVAWPLRW